MIKAFGIEGDIRMKYQYMVATGGGPAFSIGISAYCFRLFTSQTPLSIRSKLSRQEIDKFLKLEEDK